MPNEQALLADVIQNPYDDAPRQAYADWCAQQETQPPGPRATFIRAQLEIERVRRDGFAGVDRRDEIRQRLAWQESMNLEAELLEKHGPEWARPLQRWIDGYTFARGFIGHVRMSATEFIQNGRDLLASAPIVHVELTESQPILKDLFACPHLGQVRALSLVDNDLHDDDVQHIAESSQLGQIWWLDLGFNMIGSDGVDVLAASKQLAHVTFLSLQSNPLDPRETVGIEGAVIVDAALPDEGVALEARFGHIPWLHCHAELAIDFPPNPLGPPWKT